MNPPNPKIDPGKGPCVRGRRRLHTHVPGLAWTRAVALVCRWAGAIVEWHQSANVKRKPLPPLSGTWHLALVRSTRTTALATRCTPGNTPSNLESSPSSGAREWYMYEPRARRSPRQCLISCHSRLCFPIRICIHAVSTQDCPIQASIVCELVSLFGPMLKKRGIHKPRAPRSRP